MARTLEVELKAHIAAPDALRERLFLKGAYIGAFHKEDRYWFPAPESSGALPWGLRIRRERRIGSGGESEERILVTWKTKEVRDGLEVNDEREFALLPDSGTEPLLGNSPVRDAPHRALEALEELFSRLGLSPGYGKQKDGWAWRCGPVLAELLEVPPLGFFLEMETLLEDPSPEALAQGRADLLSFLDSLDIGRDQIEDRYYSELLSGRASPAPLGQSLKT
jgi:adenylate cyclase class 2